MQLYDLAGLCTDSSRQEKAEAGPNSHACPTSSHRISVCAMRALAAAGGRTGRRAWLGARLQALCLLVDLGRHLHDTRLAPHETRQAKLRCRGRAM